MVAIVANHPVTVSPAMRQMRNAGDEVDVDRADHDDATAHAVDALSCR